MSDLTVKGAECTVVSPLDVVCACALLALWYRVVFLVIRVYAVISAGCLLYKGRQSSCSLLCIDTVMWSGTRATVLKAGRKRRSACINMTGTDRRCVTSLSVVDVAKPLVLYMTKFGFPQVE